MSFYHNQGHATYPSNNLQFRNIESSGRYLASINQVNFLSTYDYFSAPFNNCTLPRGPKLICNSLCRCASHGCGTSRADRKVSYSELNGGGVRVKKINGVRFNDFDTFTETSTVSISDVVITPAETPLAITELADETAAAEDPAQFPLVVLVV